MKRQHAQKQTTKLHISLMTWAYLYTSLRLLFSGEMKIQATVSCTDHEY